MSSPTTIPRADSYRYAPTTKPNNTGLLKDKLQLVRVDSPENKHARYTIKRLPDKLPFDKGLYVFVRAIQLLAHKIEGVVLVGLAGASGSGKTTFSNKLQSLLPGIIVLSMDMYNDSSKVVDGNFDDPRLTDYDLLLQHLRDLKNGKSIQAPVYDFKLSKRVGYKTVEVPASRVVMVEGIYALSPQLRPLLDLRVSITGGVHFDLAKRVLRDINRSAQAPQEILQQITDTVYPMYKAFIEPDLQQAQLVVVNHFNPFSGFMNPIYILKSSKKVEKGLVQKILKTDTEGVESDTYDIYLLPPGEDPETCVSWLRMRNRDGKYTLMFEEWMVDDPFVISPRVQFEVSVRVLGGLMSLGYEISVVMKRHSVVYSNGEVSVKFDTIQGIPRTFVQIQGRDRDCVLNVGEQLGLSGSYIARSYIELVQLERLTSNFQTLTEDLRRKFAVNGEPMLDESSIGSLGRSPPPAEFLKKIKGFDTPDSSRASWTAPAHRNPEQQGIHTSQPWTTQDPLGMPQMGGMEHAVARAHSPVFFGDSDVAMGDTMGEDNQYPRKPTNIPPPPPHFMMPGSAPASAVYQGNNGGGSSAPVPIPRSAAGGVGGAGGGEGAALPPLFAGGRAGSIPHTGSKGQLMVNSQSNGMLTNAMHGSRGPLVVPPRINKHPPDWYCVGGRWAWCAPICSSTIIQQHMVCPIQPQGGR